MTSRLNQILDKAEKDVSTWKDWQRSVDTFSPSCEKDSTRDVDLAHHAKFVLRSE